MLVVDLDARGAVSRLHFLDQVLLRAGDALGAQNVLRIDVTLGDGIARGYPVALFHAQLLTEHELILDRFSLVRHDGHGHALVLVRDMDDARLVRHDRLSLGLTRFEQLFHAGQTLRDVFGDGDAARMEGSHGQLRAGFADGLRRDDAYRFAHLDVVARRHVLTVALGADAVLGLAGENGADTHALHARRVDRRRLIGGEHGVLFREQLARGGIEDVVHAVSARDPVAQRLDHRARSVHYRSHYAALGVAAVFLVDDDVLRNVDQPSGEVTGVCRFKSGVRQTFTSAVSGNEVFQNGKTFAV